MAQEQGTAFLHCSKCLEEWKAKVPEAEDTSPRTYARLSVAFTEKGLQVFCVRHELNVCHIDFEGTCHPADQSQDGTFGKGS